MARIVLIRGNSREADARTALFRTGFPALGHTLIEVAHGDAIPEADLILPSSDHHIVDVGRSNARQRLPGIGDDMGMTLASKSATYRWLNALGIATPKWISPSTLADIEAFDHDGPVFTKPDRGAGSFTPYAYEYKRYASTADLIAALRPHEAEIGRRRHHDRHFGPLLVMEYVDQPELHSVTAVLSGRTHIVANQTAILDHPVFPFHTALNYTKANPELFHIADAIRRAGVHRLVVYIQTMKTEQGLAVIDLNVRPNLNLAMAIDKHFPQIGIDICGCLLDDRSITSFPDPYYLLRTIYRADTTRDVKALHYHRPNNLLDLRLNPTALKAHTQEFDRQMSMPSFYLTGDDPAYLLEQADRIEAGFVIE